MESFHFGKKGEGKNYEEFHSISCFSYTLPGIDLVDFKQAKPVCTCIFLYLYCAWWGKLSLDAFPALDIMSGSAALQPALHLTWDGQLRCSRASQDPGHFDVPGMWKEPKNSFTNVSKHRWC